MHPGFRPSGRNYAAISTEWVALKASTSSWLKVVMFTRIGMTDCMKIVMSGEDVYFIEFGTGDGVEPHFDTTVPVAWGTWSAENKQILWNQGFWYYNKVRF